MIAPDYASLLGIYTNVKTKFKTIACIENTDFMVSVITDFTPGPGKNTVCAASLGSADMSGIAPDLVLDLVSGLFQTHCGSASGKRPPGWIDPTDAAETTELIGFDDLVF